MKANDNPIKRVIHYTMKIHAPNLAHSAFGLFCSPQISKEQAAQMLQRLCPSGSLLAKKSKFVSIAEETRKYFGTPERFRRTKPRSSSVGAHPRGRSPSPGVAKRTVFATDPQSPRLLTRGRSRCNNHQSADLESNTKYDLFFLVCF